MSDEPQSRTMGIDDGLLNQESIVSVSNEETLNASEKPKERLKSIDIYRGLTMFGMIIVNDQGDTPIWPLDESEWNGISTADLIFPSFLFIMGFAVPLAVRQPIKTLRFALRVAGLFLIGYLLKLTIVEFDFSVGRIPGVLQRISVCYAIVTAIHVLTQYGAQHLRRYGAMVVALATALYMGLMLGFENGCSRAGNLTPDCNFTRWLDLQILRQANTMQPTDPEGIFSTLSSLLTAYGGYRFCLIMKDMKNDRMGLIRQWFQWAILSILLSLLISLCMPYNKKLWTTSFAMLTIGVAGCMLIIMLTLIDIVGAPGKRAHKGIEIATRPFLWLGMNPLAIYILNELVPTILNLIMINSEESLWDGLYTTVFASWITQPQVCTTIFSLFWAMVWMGVAYLMFRFKVFVKL